MNRKVEKGKTDKIDINTFVEERRQRILQILEEDHRVMVPELARQFAVSVDTVRRDLRHLQKLGLLKKTHGGAIRHHISSLDPYPKRVEHEKNLKHSIGERAAGLVEEGDSILIDSSTTTLAFVQSLRINHIRIVTNDIDAAYSISKNPGYELYVLGGRWDPLHHELMGPNVIEQVKKFRVQKLFLGVSALHAKHGMTGVTEEDAAIKRTMLQVSDQVIALADHTKIGETSLSWIAPAEAVDILVTDEMAECDELEALGIQVIKVTQ